MCHLLLKLYYSGRYFICTVLKFLLMGQFFLNRLRPDSDIERRLPKENLYLVSKMSAVQKFVRRSDYAFYQALVEVLIPDVLRPIPSECACLLLIKNI